MDVSKEIQAVRDALDDVLATVPESDLYEQYRSRTVANYAQALKALLEIERMNKK